MGVGKGFIRGIFAILISPIIALYYAITLIYSLISFPIKGIKYLIQFFLGYNINDLDEESKKLNEYKAARRKMMESNAAKELQAIKEYAEHDDLEDFLNENGGNKHE